MTTGAPVVPVLWFGTREPGGSTSSLPPRKARIDVVFGAPYAVDAVLWPRTRDDVGETSRQLRSRMLADLAEAIRTTGRSLPGPLPAGQHEPDPGGGVTEKSA
jgi:1-acyl-sn-glycerol-3-phosphate acyltransferase